MTTVDRQRWLQDRIEFLEALAAAPDLPDGERGAVEAELAALRTEQGVLGSGRVARWLGWFVRLPGRG